MAAKAHTEQDKEIFQMKGRAKHKQKASSSRLQTPE